MLYMTINIFVSWLHLSNDRQYIYWSDIVNLYSRIFQSFDGHVVYPVILSGAFIVLYSQDDITYSWIFWYIMIWIRYFFCLSVHLYLHLYKACSISKCYSIEKVYFFIYLQQCLSEGFKTADCDVCGCWRRWWSRLVFVAPARREQCHRHNDANQHSYTAENAWRTVAQCLI